MKFLFLEERPALRKDLQAFQRFSQKCDILIRVSLFEESSAKRQEDRTFEDFRPVTGIV